MEALFAGMRNIASGMLGSFPDRCSIQRPPAPQPIGGSEEENPSEIASQVACAYEALNVFQRILTGSVNSAATHKITLPADTDVQALDVIVVAARGQIPQLTFQVEGRLDASFNVILEMLATLQQ